MLITAATYLGTLRFDFVADDPVLIVQNPFVRSWRYLPQYFSSTLWMSALPLDAGNYYRPLVMLWIRVMYSLFGPRPFGWHLVALALYVLTTWLVYLVAKELTGEVSVSWLTALIFGLHPIHHEVVAWVTGTTESLVTLASLGSFLAYMRFRSTGKATRQAVSCGLYAIALPCKEVAIVLPAVVFCYEWFGCGSSEQPERSALGARLRRATIAASIYIPITVVYLVARYRILLGLGHPYAALPASVWLTTLPSILTAYAVHWFYPIHLSAFYDVFYVPAFDFRHVVLPAMFLVGMAVTLWSFRNRLGGKMPVFAAAWILITLSPALATFVFHPQELVHDRYFYIPSVGAALLTAVVIVRVTKTRTGPFMLPWHVVSVGAVLSVVLAVLGVRAASFWVNDNALYSRGHEIAPLNANPMNHLAADLLDAGNVEAAGKLLAASFQQPGLDSNTVINLGRYQYLKKDYDEAESTMRRAISLEPNFSIPYFFLGQIQLRQNRVPEALESMHRAVELNPYSARFRTSYGIVLQLTGNCDGAAQQFAAALELNPDQVVAKGLQKVHCRAEGASAFTLKTKSAPL